MKNKIGIRILTIVLYFVHFYFKLTYFYSLLAAYKIFRIKTILSKANKA